jgi:hypothetical protein
MSMQILPKAVPGLERAEGVRRVREPVARADHGAERMGLQRAVERGEGALEPTVTARNVSCRVRIAGRKSSAELPVTLPIRMICAPVRVAGWIAERSGPAQFDHPVDAMPSVSRRASAAQSGVAERSMT